MPDSKENVLNPQLTVGDLLRQPTWGLELLAGAGGLDRNVTWAHPSEVDIVINYLDGGELLMSTGILIPPEAGDQVALIRRMNEKGASGLSLGTKAPPLTPELIAEADALNFPILKAPVPLGYMTVTKYVANANVAQTQQRLLRELRIYEVLTPGHMLTAHQKFSFLEKLTGYRLLVVNAQGTSLLSGMENAPPEISRESLAATLVSESNFSVTIEGDLIRPLTVLDRRAGCLVALQPADEETNVTALSSLRHVEVIAGLEIADLYRRREIRRREGSELLARFINGTQSADRMAFPSRKGANRKFVFAGCKGKL